MFMCMQSKVETNVYTNSNQILRTLKEDMFTSKDRKFIWKIQKELAKCVRLDEHVIKKKLLMKFSLNETLC